MVESPYLATLGLRLGLKLWDKQLLSKPCFIQAWHKQLWEQKRS